eukprot:2944514-Rhodomonas_salina.2
MSFRLNTRQECGCLPVASKRAISCLYGCEREEKATKLFEMPGADLVPGAIKQPVLASRIYGAMKYSVLISCMALPGCLEPYRASLSGTTPCCPTHLLRGVRYLSIIC